MMRRPSASPTGGGERCAARPNDAGRLDCNADAHGKAGAAGGRHPPDHGGCGGREGDARPLRLRRAQVSARLQALRMGESGRAERRPPLHHRHCRPHQLRQLQQLHSQGRCGPGAALSLRLADGPGARRAGRRLRAGSPFRASGERPQLGDLPVAARGQVRRRVGADGRGCRLHAQRPQGEGAPDLSRAAQGREQGRGARPPHRALHASPAPRPATCRWWLPACRSSPRPTTPRTSSIRPRSSRRWAPAPTRSTASGPAPTSATSAATTIGPRTSPSTAAASISTSCASSTIAIARPSSRASRPGPSICARSSPRAIGSRATTSPPSGKAGWSSSRCPTRTPPARRASSSTRAGPSSPTCACARRSTMRSTSSGPTRTSSTVSISAPRASSRTPT